MTLTNADYAPIPIPDDGRPDVPVLKLVGNTPLVEIKALARDVAPVRVFGKAEWANPAGSVKDRPALNMITDGIRRGFFHKDKILLDATSGNTGIAYAMVCSALGYRCRLCIPGSTGPLHQTILAAYGAELVRTPATEGSDGAQREAIRIAEKEPERYFYPDQYGNHANWRAHYHGTGIEILNQTAGRVTHFVAGLGTSGTFTGVGKRLKEYNPNIRLISYQPDSPMHGIEGLKHMPTSLKPEFYDENQADENRWVTTERAQETLLRAAKEEGLLLGTSAGGALTVALDVARELKQAGRDDAVVVTILCDAAYKYLNQKFWTAGS